MPKTREEKKQLFSMYQKMIDNGNFIIVIINRIPANSLNALRRELRELGAQFRVLKNKIFMKAASSHEDLKDIELKGPLAILDAGEDIVSALKKLDILQNKAKEELSLLGEDEDMLKDYKAYEFYLGYVDQTVLKPEELVRLKSLPDKNTLMGQLLATMLAPITGFMNVSTGNVRKFLYALNDLREKKGE